jgi:hypothetical protein
MVPVPDAGVVSVNVIGSSFRHIVCSLAIIPAVTLLTVTVAIPVPGTVVHPLASVTLVTVHEVVVAGVTMKVYGLPVIPFTVKGVVPSVKVRLHGEAPVRATAIDALAPLQIVVVPLIVAVGRGLTVTLYTVGEVAEQPLAFV